MWDKIKTAGKEPTRKFGSYRLMIEENKQANRPTEGQRDRGTDGWTEMKRPRFFSACE